MRQLLCLLEPLCKPCDLRLGACGSRLERGDRAVQLARHVLLHTRKSRLNLTQIAPQALHLLLSPALLFVQTR